MGEHGNKKKRPSTTVKHLISKTFGDFQVHLKALFGLESQHPMNVITVVLNVDRWVKMATVPFQDLCFSKGTRQVCIRFDIG